MICLAVSLVVLLVLGVPISVALGLAAAIQLLVDGVDLITVPTRMFTSVDSFVLLAAPFYILAGEIMNRGGITERLIRLSSLIVGRIRGGTAYACIVASVLFAGISGTAIADTAALGQVFINGMPKEGYDKNFAAALTVAGSIIGPIIPPSVIMVIYASVVQLSVIDLFLAGVVPGLLLGGACALVIALHGRGGRLPRSRLVVTRAEVPRLALEGALVVSLPLIIVVGTISGAFTATEAGGVAVAYAAAIGWLVFRNLDMHEVWSALIVTARTTSTLFLVLGGASVAAYVLTLAGIAEWAGEMKALFAGRPIAFMFAVVGLLLVVGCFLDPAPAVVLFVPLLMPIARSMAIDPLQFSMIVILTLTIGLITPPVGVCLYVACRIGNLAVGRLFRSVLPFLVAEVLVVVVMIFVPWLSSGLPRLLRGA